MKMVIIGLTLAGLLIAYLFVQFMPLVSPRVAAELERIMREDNRVTEQTILDQQAVNEQTRANLPWLREDAAAALTWQNLNESYSRQVSPVWYLAGALLLDIAVLLCARTLTRWLLRPSTQSVDLEVTQPINIIYPTVQSLDEAHDDEDDDQQTPLKGSYHAPFPSRVRREG